LNGKRVFIHSEAGWVYILHGSERRALKADFSGPPPSPIRDER
jgi:hypothetical protein